MSIIDPKTQLEALALKILEFLEAAAVGSPDERGFMSVNKIKETGAEIGGIIDAVSIRENAGLAQTRGTSPRGTPAGGRLRGPDRLARAGKTVILPPRPRAAGG